MAHEYTAMARQICAGKPADAMYGPFNSIQEFLTWCDNNAIELTRGITVGITQQDGTVIEYSNNMSNSVSTFVVKTQLPELAAVATSGSYEDLNNKPTIPAVNNVEVKILQNGVEKGSFRTNQSEDSSIDVGQGEETVFTADFLKKVLICRANNKVYMTSGFDPTPNMPTFNGFGEPGTSSTNWAGWGVAASTTAGSRLCIHNVNVEPWKGRKFRFTAGEGFSIAIASGTVTQSPSWNKPYPQTSDLPWNWHASDDPVEVTLGDMLAIMVKRTSGTFDMNSLYSSIWFTFDVEECSDSVKNPPRQLVDNRYVGYRVGVLGDSILAGASTKAYKTALDVLVSDYGIIPVPRCQAGTCISPASATYSNRDPERFVNRLEPTWRNLAAGTNGTTTYGGNVWKDPDPFLGVLIFGVNDVLMAKKPIEAKPFVRELTEHYADNVQLESTWDVHINTSALDPEGYLASLLELETSVKSAGGSLLNHFYLIGPYNCVWPGNFPMNTLSKNPNGDTGEDFIRVQRQFCMVKGWSYLDILGSQLNAFLPGMCEDKLHPTQKGHQILGDHIGQFLCSSMLTQSSNIFENVDSTNNDSANAEDIETLKRNTQLANETLDAEVELSLDGYIDATTHEFIESNDYRCSGFVYVRGAKTIEYKTRSLGDSYHLCFYDKDKNSISALDFPVASGGVQGSIDLTDNTYADVYYVIMSAYPGGYPPYLRIKGKFDFSKALTEGEVKTSHGINVFNPSDIELSTRLNTDGSLATGYDKHMVSGLIEVSPGSSALYFKNLPIVPEATDARYLIWYNSSKAYLSGTTITGTEATAALSIPADAKYFRFSVYQNVTIPQTYSEDIDLVMVSFTDVDFTPFKENIKSIGKHVIIPDFINEEYTGLRAITDNPLAHILREPGYGSIIHHWGFIGDSLCSGEMMGGPTPIDCYEYSWGQRFCKLVGTEGYCFSHGGCSTLGWLAGGTDHRNDNPPYAGGAQGGGWSVAKESGMKKQAYIIALGVNDMIAETPVGSTDDYREYDPDNDTDYGPNSFCSYYMQIINRLKYIQPNAKIFLMTTLPKGLWSYPDIDEAVRNIYEYYQDIYPNDVFLLDIARYLTADLMSGMFYLSSHGSAAGYQYFAYVVNTYIDWIIRNNGTAFRSVAIDCGYPADYDNSNNNNL